MNFRKMCKNTLFDVTILYCLNKSVFEHGNRTRTPCDMCTVFFFFFLDLSQPLLIRSARRYACVGASNYTWKIKINNQIASETATSVGSRKTRFDAPEEQWLRSVLFDSFFFFSLVIVAILLVDTGDRCSSTNAVAHFWFLFSSPLCLLLIIIVLRVFVNNLVRGKDFKFRNQKQMSAR